MVQEVIQMFQLRMEGFIQLTLLRIPIVIMKSCEWSAQLRRYSAPRVDDSALNRST